MTTINNQELEYIDHLVLKGRENARIQFKKEWYNLDKEKYKDTYRSGVFEFIKDCISFLNANMDLNKYIIIGIEKVNDEGFLSFHKINERYDESNLQKLISEYITPVPKIDIITKVKCVEEEVDIIRIGRENNERPYLFKKSFPYQEDDKFERLCTGIGYIREGSSSRTMTRKELTGILFNR